MARRRGGPADGGRNITGYRKILLNEVMPMVDKAYNVSQNREQRAIAGLSMGGAETLFVGLNDLAVRVDQRLQLGDDAVPRQATAAAPRAAAPGGRSGAPRRGARRRPWRGATAGSGVFAKIPALDAKANSKIRMLWIVCGTPTA